jgi:2-keto-4-pentenoate hydratase/2-oxohepta-3-ene-1,7-dioic acid hydratase in catechol pathway
MIYSCADHFVLFRLTYLHPGDIIATGTPEGGSAAQPTGVDESRRCNESILQVAHCASES